MLLLPTSRAATEPEMKVGPRVLYLARARGFTGTSGPFLSPPRRRDQDCWNSGECILDFPLIAVGRSQVWGTGAESIGPLWPTTRRRA